MWVNRALTPIVYKGTTLQAVDGVFKFNKWFFLIDADLWVRLPGWIWNAPKTDHVAHLLKFAEWLK